MGVLDGTPYPSWREHKKDKDRTFYSLVKGFVVAYHEKAADASESARDLIDVSHLQKTICAKTKQFGTHPALHRFRSRQTGNRPV